MSDNMIAVFEQKLKNIKESVQELEDFLPIMKEEYAKKQGKSQGNGSENVFKVPFPPNNSAPPVVDLPPGNDNEITTPPADEPESGQQVVKLEPEELGASLGNDSETANLSASPIAEPEIRQQIAKTGPEAEVSLRKGSEISTPPTAPIDKPDLGQKVVKLEPEDGKQAQKRRADDPADAPSLPDPKRALIRAKPDRSNEFTIFNSKKPRNGRLSVVTREEVARMLPFLGAKGLFVPSDIELMPRPISHCPVKDLSCIQFKVHGLMAVELRNWVNGPTYAEDSHLENAKHFPNPALNAYLLNTTDYEKISVFGLMFLAAQEIRETLRINVQLAPDYLDFRNVMGNRGTLTFTDLISCHWISFAKSAYGKMNTIGRNTLDCKIREMGLPNGLLKKMMAI